MGHRHQAAGVVIVKGPCPFSCTEIPCEWNSLDVETKWWGVQWSSEFGGHCEKHKRNFWGKFCGWNEVDFFGWKKHSPGDSKCPFHPLVGGHLTPWKGRLTIPKRSLWITRHLLKRVLKNLISKWSKSWFFELQKWESFGMFFFRV